MRPSILGFFTVGMTTLSMLSVSCVLYSAGSAGSGGQPVAGWPQKRELGPLSSGQGKSMQVVDPDRIEKSDHVQAASFAPHHYHHHHHHRDM